MRSARPGSRHSVACCCRGVRSDIATGTVLGLGRIIGSTAIVVLLLGDSLQNSPTGSVPLLGFLRGTGSTLTSYIFENSPAG